MSQLRPPVDPERDHLRGDPSATFVLVEYGDFQCPHCARATSVLEELVERVDQDLVVVWRHLPIPTSHPLAARASLAAEAAAVQDRFWDYHDRLFAHQDDLTEAALREHADALGLDLARFDASMNDRELETRVEDDVDSAVRSGVTATPSFFLDGALHTGKYTTEAMLQALNARFDASGADRDGEATDDQPDAADGSGSSAPS